MAQVGVSVERVTRLYGRTGGPLGVLESRSGEGDRQVDHEAEEPRVESPELPLDDDPRDTLADPRELGLGRAVKQAVTAPVPPGR